MTVKMGTAFCDWPREANPQLFDLLAVKLLVPGWPGEADEMEAAYLAYHLRARPALRRAWRSNDLFHGRGRRNISPEMAARLVLAWRTGEFRGGRRTGERGRGHDRPSAKSSLSAKRPSMHASGVLGASRDLRRSPQLALLEVA